MNPCPFCGSLSIIVRAYSNGPEITARASCHGCEASGPSTSVMDNAVLAAAEAMRLWRDRSPSSQPLKAVS